MTYFNVTLHTYLASYVLNYCFMQAAAAYRTAIDTYCDGGTTTEDACDIAGDAIGEECLAPLVSGDNATCIGLCGSQLATAAAACTTTVSYDR